MFSQMIKDKSNRARFLPSLNQSVDYSQMNRSFELERIGKARDSLDRYESTWQSHIKNFTHGLNTKTKDIY